MSHPLIGPTWIHQARRAPASYQSEARATAEPVPGLFETSRGPLDAAWILRVPRCTRRDVVSISLQRSSEILLSSSFRSITSSDVCLKDGQRCLHVLSDQHEVYVTRHCDHTVERSSEHETEGLRFREQRPALQGIRAGSPERVQSTVRVIACIR